MALCALLKRVDFKVRLLKREVSKGRVFKEWPLKNGRFGSSKRGLLRVTVSGLLKRGRCLLSVSIIVYFNRALA